MALDMEMGLGQGHIALDGDPAPPPQKGAEPRILLMLNNFFPIVDTRLRWEDMARRSCAMVPRWRFLVSFLGPAFPASRVQHVSDLHSIFALRPHHVLKYSRHPICEG